MRSTSLAFLSIVAAAVAQTLNVNSPPLTVCQPAAILYSGGTAPYFLSVIPGGQTNAAALQSFPTTATTTAGSYTWNVNIAAGTPVTLQLKDNTGAIAYSGILTIAANTDTSCVGVAASTAPAASSAAVVSSTPGAASSAVASTSRATSVAAGTSSAASAGSSVVSRISSAATGTTASSAPAAASSKPASASTTGLSMFALLGAAVVAIAA